jgi:hypothetical protein
VDLIQKGLGNVEYEVSATSTVQRCEDGIHAELGDEHGFK